MKKKNNNSFKPSMSWLAKNLIVEPVEPDTLNLHIPYTKMATVGIVV